MILGCARTDSMNRLTAPMRALACETPERVRKKGFHRANWMGIALITHGSSSAEFWYIYSHTWRRGPGLGGSDLVRKKPWGIRHMGLCIQSFRTFASGSKTRSPPPEGLRGQFQKNKVCVLGFVSKLYLPLCVSWNDTVLYQQQNSQLTVFEWWC